MKKRDIQFGLFSLSSILVSGLMFGVIVVYEFHLSDSHGFFRLFAADVEEHFSRANNFNLDIYYRNLPLAAIIAAFGGSKALLYIVNLAIYNILVYKMYQSNGSSLFLFLMCLPNLLIALILPSKDLYTIFSICFCILYIEKKNLNYVFCALLFAFIARIEFFIILVMIFFFLRRRVLWPSLGIIFLCITFFYNYLPRSQDFLWVLVRGASDNSIALHIETLARDFYLYPVAFPLKVLSALNDGGLVNLFLFMFLILWALARGVNQKFIYIFVVFCVFATIPSFPHFRYLAPAYVMLFYIASKHKLTKRSS